MPHCFKTFATFIFACFSAMGALPVWAGDIHALVIGIDRYEQITPLKGAVNDALDIAGALGQYDPANLVLLTDEQATRERILTTWQGFLDQAQSGDTIVVTFAGHGMNEPAAFPEFEEDGLDEVYLLAGFGPQGAAAGQRIRDDEVAAMITQRPDLHHVIVADSCHSGSATRSTRFDLTYRVHKNTGIRKDPLPTPPSPQSWSETGQIDQLATFFGAVSDAEKVPEVMIDGQVRGALSYAFAQGLRGQADRNTDGVITKGELQTHIQRFVKNQLNGRQRPEISPPGRMARSLFLRKQVAVPDQGGLKLGYDALPEMTLAFEGPRPASLRTGYPGARLVAAHPADIVVDFTRREIRDAQGDMLRRLTTEVGADWSDQIQKTVNRMRLVQGFKDSALSSKLEVVFPFGDTLYLEDDSFGVQITGRDFDHVTVLNLTSEGKVQWLYPRYAPLDGSGYYADPASLPPEARLRFDATVTPPFGAEFLVVLQSQTPHDAARQAVAAFDSTAELEGLWEALRDSSNEVPLQVGIHGFFTTDDKAL